VDDVQFAAAQPGLGRGEPQRGHRLGGAVDPDQHPARGVPPQHGTVRGVVVPDDDHRSPGVLGDGSDAVVSLPERPAGILRESPTDRRPT
jgi:hypothetical protein